MSQIATTTQLTEQDICSLFEYESGPWQVACQNIDLANRWVRGDVLHDGEKVGDFLRTWDSQGRQINHSSYGLGLRGHSTDGIERPQYRRQGFTRQWITHCFARYRDAGFESVTVSASNDGSSVWHRFGFQVSRMEWRRMLGLTRSIMEHAYLDSKIDEDAYDAWQQALPTLKMGKPDLAMLDSVIIDSGGTSLLSQIAWEGELAL